MKKMNATGFLVLALLPFAVAACLPVGMAATVLPPEKCTLTSPAQDARWCSLTLTPDGRTVVRYPDVVHATGGELAGKVSIIAPGAKINLSSGTKDWIKLPATVGAGSIAKGAVRKYTVRPLITSPIRIAGNTTNPTVYPYGDTYILSWTDAATTKPPKLGVVMNDKRGVYLTGPPNRSGRGYGFELSVPTSPDPQTLFVYVGVAYAAGRFSARLSDNSAPEYVDTSLDTVWPKQENAVYAITFSSPGQARLIVRWTTERGVTARMRAAALR